MPKIVMKMCFDISLLFGNKPLFVQLSTNKFGRLLTAHQHTAKDRPMRKLPLTPLAAIPETNSPG